MFSFFLSLTIFWRSLGFFFFWGGVRLRISFFSSFISYKEILLIEPVIDMIFLSSVPSLNILYSK